jgi:hypothetical protein
VVKGGRGGGPCTAPCGRRSRGAVEDRERREADTNPGAADVVDVGWRMARLQNMGGEAADRWGHMAQCQFKPSQMVNRVK